VAGVDLGDRAGVVSLVVIASGGIRCR